MHALETLKNIRNLSMLQAFHTCKQLDGHDACA